MHSVKPNILTAWMTSRMKMWYMYFQFLLSRFPSWYTLPKSTVILTRLLTFQIWPQKLCPAMLTFREPLFTITRWDLCQIISPISVLNTILHRLYLSVPNDKNWNRPYLKTKCYVTFEDYNNDASVSNFHLCWRGGSKSWRTLEIYIP